MFQTFNVPKSLVSIHELFFLFLLVSSFLLLNGISDILFLNKQRLKAVEELNKTNKERELLLEKIDLLESEKQASSRKGDWNLIPCCPQLINAQFYGFSHYYFCLS